MKVAASVLGVHVSAYGVGAGFCWSRFAIICAAVWAIGNATEEAVGVVMAEEAAADGAFVAVTPAEGVSGDVAGRVELLAGNTEEDSRAPDIGLPCGEEETG